MPYYPVFLDLAGQDCLVVGGGGVAERKVNGLLEAGAGVTVVSPHLTADLQRLKSERVIAHIGRDYKQGDIDDFHLVIAATDNEEINRAVAAAAKQRNVPVNVVDRTDLCSFILPSVINRGPLQIAVSTGGQSPAAAVRIRRRLEAEFGQEYGEWVSIIGEFRRRLRASQSDEALRRSAYERLLNSDLLDKVKAHERIDIDGLIAEFTR